MSKRQIFNFKKANWTKLNENFSTINWSTIINDGHNDVEIAWSKFKKIFFEKANIHIPKLKIKPQFQPPWYDSEVHELCRQKERLRSKFKNSKADADYMKYSKCRSDVKKLVKQKMRDNFSDDNDTALINKKFWSHVKASTNSHRIPESVHYKECHHRDHFRQAEIFNTFFFDQFSEKSNYNIPLDDSKMTDPSFHIDFDHIEISTLLRNINPNKAQGPDGIHGRILKNCAATLAYPISKLFRLSYSTGHIPAEWKLANVVPIHKKGSKSNVENYRPISLTSIVMKQFEKVVRMKLMKLCENFINDNQHGFLPKKSCTTQMVAFTDSLAVALNDNFRVDTIYFDFMKAFDSVNHDLLLHKLKYKYKVDGQLLRFLKCYLKNRKQQVVISSATSTCFDVCSGVPQGSIIGPLLFVLFINDINEGLSDDTNIALYADDTKLWRVIKTPLDHIILQNDIDILNDWAIRNKMKFHPSKCHVLPVTRQRLPPVEQRYTYKLNGIVLDYYSTEKDLGVHVTTKLSWTDHCNKLYSLAASRLGLSMRTCHFLQNQDQKRVLYLALVRSQFAHCSIVWRPYNESTKLKLESIQKRAIKWILNEMYASYSKYMYILKCKHLNILPINSHFLLIDLITFHQIFYNTSPIKLPHYLHHYDGNSRLRKTHLDHLSIISDIIPATFSQNKHGISDYQTFDQCYFYRTHTAWNSLPLKLREIWHFQHFKTNLKKYIWNEILVTLLNEEEFQNL